MPAKTPTLSARTSTEIETPAQPNWPPKRSWKGQQDALDHAKAKVAVRSLSAADIAAARDNPEPVALKLGVPVVTLNLILAGRLDTATSACVDFLNSPFADQPGDPCPASFLTCLACANLVITPQHLPRLVALLDALDNVATIVPPRRWTLSYAEHYARLRRLLGVPSRQAAEMRGDGVRLRSTEHRQA